LAPNNFFELFLHHNNPGMDVPKSALSENEVEFLAEDELITITPAFHCNKIACINVRRADFSPPPLVNLVTDLVLLLF
jgi:hypothetical protein